VGHVWLDRVDSRELATTGFGAELRAALSARNEHLRQLGLDPDSRHLRWQLRDLQQAEVARKVHSPTHSVTSVRAGFEGTVHIRQEKNGERFIEVRGPGEVVVLPASRHSAALNGKVVQISFGSQRRVDIVELARANDRGLER